MSFDPAFIQYLKSLHEIKKKIDELEIYKRSAKAAVEDLKKKKAELQKRKNTRNNKTKVLPTISEIVNTDRNVVNETSRVKRKAALKAGEVTKALRKKSKRGGKKKKSRASHSNSASASGLEAPEATSACKDEPDGYGNIDKTFTKHLASTSKCTATVVQLSSPHVTNTKEDCTLSNGYEPKKSEVFSTPPQQHSKIEEQAAGEQKGVVSKQNEPIARTEPPASPTCSPGLSKKTTLTPRRRTRFSNGKVENQSLESSLKEEEKTLVKPEKLKSKLTVTALDTLKKKSKSLTELSNQSNNTKKNALGIPGISHANMTLKVQRPHSQGEESSHRTPVPLPEKRITRSRMAKPKENIEIEATDEESPNRLPVPQPEKIINRSTMAKPKENVEIEASDEESSDRAPVPQPQKIITRSRMAKPKENIEIEATDEESSDRTPVPLPEKRITRSRMAKPKENIEIEATDEESPNRLPVPQPEEIINRSTMAKPKENVEIEASDDSDDSSGSEDPPATCRKDLPPSTSKPLNDIANNQHSCLSASKSSERKLIKYTPLQTPKRPAAGTPSSATKIPFIASAGKTKGTVEQLERKRREEELLRKRREEAARKKYELMKAKQEDIRRKNEEKKLKSAALREAVLKETTERLKVIEKEKEEKERAIREQLQKKKDEELVKKKQKDEAKALEAEMRRLKEEETRLAKFKEMEEEKKKGEEIRLKQQQAMENMKKMRMEEMRLKEIRSKVPEVTKKKALTKDKENYDINDDVDSDEEEERKPSDLEIPVWAKKSQEKAKREKACALIPMDEVLRYFACPSRTPDLTQFFGKMTMKRIRTSSAVWFDDTPPIKQSKQT